MDSLIRNSSFVWNVVHSRAEDRSWTRPVNTGIPQELILGPWKFPGMKKKMKTQKYHFWIAVDEKHGDRRKGHFQVTTTIRRYDLIFF